MPCNGTQLPDFTRVLVIDGNDYPHARRETDLLREYRSRLIADVVTGKVDVRAAAAGLGDAEGLTDGHVSLM